jgi:hypothetical protein
MAVERREEMFEQGLHDPGGEYRTDVYVTKSEDSDGRRVLEVNFVNGSASYSLVDLDPACVKRLGGWLRALAREAVDRTAEEDC